MKTKRLFFNFGCYDNLYNAFRKYQEETRLNTSVIFQLALERYLIDEGIDRYPEVFKLLGEKEN